MSEITQSITVDIIAMTADGPVMVPQTWDVEFDSSEADHYGPNAAVDLSVVDFRYLDPAQTPNCLTARRVAIAKHLGGPLPEGVS